MCEDPVSLGSHRKTDERVFAEVGRMRVLVQLMNPHQDQAPGNTNGTRVSFAANLARLDLGRRVLHHPWNDGRFWTDRAVPPLEWKKRSRRGIQGAETTGVSHVLGHVYVRVQLFSSQALSHSQLCTAGLLGHH